MEQLRATHRGQRDELLAQEATYDTGVATAAQEAAALRARVDAAEEVAAEAADLRRREQEEREKAAAASRDSRAHSDQVAEATAATEELEEQLGATHAEGSHMALQIQQCTQQYMQL